MMVPSIRWHGMCLAVALSGALCAWGMTPWSVSAQTKPKPPTAAPKSATKPAGDSRAQDEAAIQKTVDALIDAFSSGDAAAAAGALTDGAELIPADGARLIGREAIQQAYTAYLGRQAKVKIELDKEALRFLSKDTAIEEGRMHVSRDGGAPTVQRYHFLHVRDDGRWLIGVIREWPHESDGLAELEWLIGDWKADQKEAGVQATYDWVGNKAFIRAAITARQKDQTLTAVQLIGLDPRTGGLRLWAFEHDGGFAEGTCTRDGDSWLFETDGVLSDGRDWSARNILLRVNQDTITWQPVNRTIGDDVVEDLPPVKVVRTRKAK